MRQQRQHVLIILIILAIPLTLLSSLLINAVQLPPQLKPFAWPLLAIVALGLIAVTVWQIFLDKDSERATQVRENKNRQRLLAKVRIFWIKGFLEQSLHGAALIALGLHEQPDAVVNPWNLVLRPHDQPARPLPLGTRITQVFDEADNELLILGEPGSGKTTLLLELTRDLLVRAQQDETHPLPVIFNLSSWAEKRLPLTRWLVEELNSKYQVPNHLGHSWVNGDEILPLLDGLDEVALDFRAACVDTINSYRRQHGLVPIVVCCRSAEYFAQPTRVLLHDAVVVEPLTTEQINIYLTNAGGQLASVQLALDKDPILQEVVTTPLMLSILSLTYQGKLIENLKVSDSPDTQRQQIFTDYVQRMLERRRAEDRYNPQQTIHWLAWLASQLKEYSQTEFYIERMQLDWLPMNLFYQLFPTIIVGLIYGLGVGLIYGLFFGLYLEPNLPLGLVCGSIFALLNWFVFVLVNGLDLSNKKIRSEDEIVYLNANRRQRLIKLFENRLVYGLIFGLLNGILIGWLIIFSNFNQGLFSGIVYGLINAILATLTFGFLGKLDTRIQPAEILSWSWMSFRHNLLRSLASGLLVGLIYGVLLGFLLNSLLFEISIGLGLGLVLVLLLCLTSGLSHEMLNEQNLIIPNQGIRNSMRNSVFAGLGSGLVSGFGFGLPQGLGFGPHNGLVFGLVLGLSAGLIFWLRSGGIACILHAILRVCLWHNHLVPLNYPRFLDYAVGHILLRRVGGGYIFIHRLLLDYFAAQFKTVSVTRVELI